MLTIYLPIEKGLRVRVTFRQDTITVQVMVLIGKKRRRIEDKNREWIQIYNNNEKYTAYIKQASDLYLKRLGVLL